MTSSAVNALLSPRDPQDVAAEAQWYATALRAAVEAEYRSRHRAVFLFFLDGWKSAARLVAVASMLGAAALIAAFAAGSARSAAPLSSLRSIPCDVLSVGRLEASTVAAAGMAASHPPKAGARP